MKRKTPLVVKARRSLSRCGPLLFVCQRVPITQVISHEARVLGVSGFSQVAKWSIAVVSGLGAFDCVSGATVLQQVAPVAGSSTVPATNGRLLNFTVQVTGAPSRPKSWKLTGALPAGLTHENKVDSYFDSVTGFPTQNGSFPVTITAYEKAGYTGGAVAKAFTITVTGVVSPPAITTQPAAATTVNAGSKAVLSVGASGTSPSYQWYTGAAGNTANPIAGAVAATYTTPALLTTSSYWVRVTNAGGGVNSGTAVVTVIEPPAISGQPASTSINAGGTTTLSVTASGTSPAFQWYAGASGDLSNPIVGALGATYTTPALAATASYWVKVTNAAASLNSDTAVVTVIEPPAISGQPASTSINAGGTTTLSVTASGTSPAFQWYAGASGDLSNPIVGALGATYTTPALAATASYWVKVTNAAASLNSDTAVVTVIEPPAISGQPASTSINAGGTTTLNVTASGTSPAFQWYQGATGDTTNAISGAAGPSFTTPSLAATTSYWVRVTNPAGAVDSNTATISVSAVDTFSSWAATRFTVSQAADPAISGPAMDPDGDGITNEQEFVFGGAPLAGDRPVTQSMDPVAGEFSLSFQASPASGPGYAGLTRHYAVESSRTLGGSVVWSVVPGFSNIIGNGQTVNFRAPVLPGSDFYHVKVWLASE